MSNDTKHHAEPVALPERRPEDSGFDTDDAFGNGWNNCLDEIAKLGPLYSRPVPGEPMAVFSIDATGYRARILESATSGLPADGTLLYAHADPGDIERLRGENEDLRSQLGAEISKSTGLRTLADGANKWRQRAIDSQLAARDLTGANNELHAKLAERDADLEFWKKSCRTWEAVANGMHVRLYNVLLAVLNGSKLSYHAWPLNSAELEPLDASSPVFLVGGKDGTIAISPYSEPETASAEPTDRICTHPVGCAQCSWCGFKSQRHTFTNCAPGPRMSALAERQEEASAPVEIDERADYEKWLNEHVANHGSLGEVSRRQMLSENPEEAAWEGWEGRAALERKA